MLINKTIAVTIIAGFAQALGCSSGNSSPSYYDGRSQSPPMINVQSSPPSDTDDVVTEGDIFDLPIVRGRSPQTRKSISNALRSLMEDPELSELQRESSNYEMEVRQNKQNFFVVFSPKIRAAGPPEGSGQTDVALDLYYVVRKIDQKVIARKFFK